MAFTEKLIPVKFDLANGVLAIWPTSGYRQGAATQISPQTGMFGYPGFNQAGVAVKALFNPTLRRGGLINAQSDLTPAYGNWVVLSLDLDLESQVFGGQSGKRHEHRGSKPCRRSSILSSSNLA